MTDKEIADQDKADEEKYGVTPEDEFVVYGTVCLSLSSLLTIF